MSSLCDKLFSMMLMLNNVVFIIKLLITLTYHSVSFLSVSLILLYSDDSLLYLLLNFNLMSLLF